mgnify:CR=1 FL=1
MLWGDGKSKPQTIAVVGLGRFGGSVADALTRLGHEVLGIDEDGAVVAGWRDRLAHAVEADGTDDAVLRDLGVDRMPHAVVGIGNDMEASILAASALVEIGVPDVWGKALGPRHGRLLTRIGVNHVVYPETAMGERVAYQVAERVLDYIDFNDGFGVAKVSAPASLIGRALGDTMMGAEFGVTVVGLKRGAAPFVAATPETRVEAGDLLIVAADTQAIQRFARAG